MYKSFWEENAKLLLKTCKYVCMFNPLEIFSSVIGNLYNAFLPCGIPHYAGWVTKLHFPYSDENSHLVHLLKNIWQCYKPRVFAYVVSSIPLKKAPYYWLYSCFSKDEFYLFLCESENKYVNKKAHDCLVKALQEHEINRIQKAYQLDFNFSAIGNDVSNIYY